MKRFFFVIFIITVFVSCNKENSTSIQNEILNGYFQLSIGSTYTNSKIIGSLIGGDIYYSYNNEQDFKPLNAGTMFISNSLLTYKPKIENGKYYSNSYGGFDVIDSLSQKPIIGGIGKWGISGNNNINEFLINLYTPKIININNPQPNLARVSNDGFPLEWEKDNNIDSIQIVINIPIDSSYDENHKLTYTLWSKTIPDNGEYFISANILSMRKSDIINISLLRKMVDTVKNDNINFIFYRLTSTDIDYIVKR